MKSKYFRKLLKILKSREGKPKRRAKVAPVWFLCKENKFEDNLFYQIKIKMNLKSKNLTIFAQQEDSKKADFLIEIPNRKAKALLNSHFDGSYFNLTNSLQIENDR